MMGFGLRLEFLCGRYSASAYNDRQAAEWPPHWARLFYALVDTWAATGCSDLGRAALEWLESLGDPAIFATSEVSHRSAVTHYVPVNDVNLTKPDAYEKRYERVTEALASGSTAKLRRERNVEEMVADADSTPIKAAREMLPDHRGRQPRHYPAVRPADPSVAYWWSEAAQPEQPEGLDLLLSDVVRLGHSSSFIAVSRIGEAPVGEAWLPRADGTEPLRSTRPGLLQLLEKDFNQHKASRPRTMRSVTVRYQAPSRQAAPRSDPDRPITAGPWRLMGLVDPADPARSITVPGRLAAQLTDALRGAIIAHAPKPRLGLICGHEPDGSPMSRPHASYLALPNVGHYRSTGAISGLAVMVPEGTPNEDLDVLDAALARWSGALGRSGRWQVGAADPSLATLDRRRWSRPSRTWITATPLALGRFPAGLRRERQSRSRAIGEAVLDSASDDIRQACEHLGLPAPLEVVASLAPLLDGALPVRAFPKFSRGGVRRALVHAKVTFAAPIAGPLVLGSGRYLGLGLCLPVGSLP
jgi:CRISPR-associated protein Csb2